MFPAADHTEHPSHSLIPSHADGRASVTPIFYSAVFQGTNNSRKIVVRTSVRSITTVSFICSASRESSLFSQVHLQQQLFFCIIQHIQDLSVAHCAHIATCKAAAGSSKTMTKYRSFSAEAPSAMIFFVIAPDIRPSLKRRQFQLSPGKKKRLTKRRRIIPLLFVI